MYVNEIKETLTQLRLTTPLVHNITNNVTINDCANALLAIGGSPIMGDEVKDVVEITQICSSLVINIGTLCQSSVEAMMGAGARASELKHPIVLDPVGAGASSMRTETAKRIMENLSITAVRGNMSEIKALANALSDSFEVSVQTRGVDVAPDDVVTPGNMHKAAMFAQSFAAVTNSVVAITGAIDIVADKNRSVALFNGSPLQGRITGAGCMLSSISGAFLASSNDPFVAMVAAVCSMGVAGEQAQQRMGHLDGNGSYRMYLLDALYNLDPETLAKCAKIEAF